MSRPAVKVDVPPEPAPLPAAAASTFMLPLALLFPSPLNPRKNFPPDAIEELAASIRANGLLQPLTGRETEAGFEIYIGGRRLLALQLLDETGDWPEEHLPGRLVPVIHRQIEDLDILKVALAENVNRSDMSPIEEGNAFSLLVAGGTTTADIARLYGKGQRWVQERIRVATNLAPEAQDALTAGQITLDTARALARTDNETQLRHLDSVKGGTFSANRVRSIVFHGLPLVPLAIFDVRLYEEAGGEVIEGEDDEYARFANVDLFRRLQSEAIEARLAELRESWAWVTRIEEEFWQPFSNGYHQHSSLSADPARHGAVLRVSPSSLRVDLFTGLELKDATKPGAGAGTGATDPVDAIGTGQRNYARRARGMALQAAVLRSHADALRCAILGLVLGSNRAVVLQGTTPIEEFRAVHPEITEMIERFVSLEFDGIKFHERNVRQPYLLSSDDGPALWQALRQMSDTAVADFFDALVAARVGSFNGDVFHNPLGDDCLPLAMAESLGVDNNMATWQIDSAYLATLRGPQLDRLAQAIGLLGRLHHQMKPDTFNALKVGKKRTTLLKWVQATGIRHVPPEVSWGMRKSVEAAVRAAEHLK